MFVPTSTLFSLLLALPLMVHANTPPSKRQDSTSTTSEGAMPPTSTSTRLFPGPQTAPEPPDDTWQTEPTEPLERRAMTAEPTGPGASASSRSIFNSRGPILPDIQEVKRTEIPDGYERDENNDEFTKRAEGDAHNVLRLIPPDYTLFEFPAPHDNLNCRSNLPECHPDLKFTNEWKDQVFDVKQFGLDPEMAGGVEAHDVDFTTRSATKIVQCTAKVDASPTEMVIFEPRMTDPWPQEDHKGAGHLTCTLASTATAAATPVRR
ncbi:hypothetical protein I302_107402 [Kwoniella bestiolae CBS 10118]|uniref:Phosphatidylglycerol/phosphatidylinositol transfer protein n=1 Tax=Kwoniella bestiolae CBS 10118 TaxID=1296100 RepID=A0A1B9FYM1_9TREE|nr:hypothetical protein I302_06859 [Kwoniella bestiolae CBS 10118]OCF23873.1 hypothetical protein I302_06859 [Kwoniella bestiolae CBS 10118]